MTNDIRYDIRNDVHTPNTRFRVKGTSMVPTLLSGDDVIVSPVTTDSLIPGDFVFITSGNTAYIHRFIRRTKLGLITKGDGHRVQDPVWDAEAIRGRAVEAWRGNKCIYRRTPKSLRWNRLLALRHRLTGFLWKHLRRMKTWLLPIILLLIPTIALSAVTLVYFEVDPGDQAIFVYWETASEAGNLGFYLWRSEEEQTGYYKLPVSDPNLHFIPSADEGAGTFYDYVDDEVTSGVLYYYKVQDVPDSGIDGEFSQPLSGGIGIVTETPTPTLTPTFTPTSTATPQPATPYVNFWTELETVTAGECTTLQWQTNNVKSVFLDGEGVPGLGAKTYCPCENEAHTLVVYYQDDTRQDFTIDLEITGDCEEQAIAPTLTLTTTVTLQPTATTVSGTPTDIAETPTSQPTEIRTRNTPVKPTHTPTTQPLLRATPTVDDTGKTPIPLVDTTDQIKKTPTPTRAIVEGNTPRQSLINQSTALLVLSALAGCVLLSIGIWLWSNR